MLWLLSSISSAYNRAIACKSTGGDWFIMSICWNALLANRRLSSRTIGSHIALLHPWAPVGLLTTTSPIRISSFVLGNPPPIPISNHQAKANGWKCGSHVNYYSSSRNGAIYFQWQACYDDIMTGNLSQRICAVITCGS